MAHYAEGYADEPVKVKRQVEAPPVEQLHPPVLCADDETEEPDLGDGPILSAKEAAEQQAFELQNLWHHEMDKKTFLRLAGELGIDPDRLQDEFDLEYRGPRTLGATRHLEEAGDIDVDAAFEEAMFHRSCYLAGPMRGYPDYNFPAFHKATADLRSRGWKVWSPAERDEEDPTVDLTSEAAKRGDQTNELAYFMQFDLPAVCQSDAVICLPGWEESVGANLEVHVAQVCDIPVLEYGEDGELTEVDQAQEPAIHGELEETPQWVKDMVLGAHRAQVGETRTTSSTGGEKGVKRQRMDLVPWTEVREVAELYAAGADKYDDHNWRRGYEWSKSFAALMRHVTQWWEGEELDEETGCNHLTAVIFHALALLYFSKHHRNFDDRPPLLTS